MEWLPVNWWAVLVAAIVKFVLGLAWYAPPVMGRQWQAAVGISDADMRAGLPRAIPIDIVASLVMAYILARLIGLVGATGVGAGALIGLMAWLGFVATVTISGFAYERRPFKLFVINNVYLLVAMVVMGAILAAWQVAPVAAETPG